MGWIQAGFGQGSGGKRVLLRELRARNDFETIADASRIEGNIDKRETFKDWEVGRTFLALSPGCTAKVPLYASMHSGDAAICVRYSFRSGLVGLESSYSCLTCKHIKHSYVAQWHTYAALC